MENKLTVTNYDNFKNADFFINQYFEAEKMIKEVNEFFQSFYMSKLLTAKDLINIRPKWFGGSYDHEWTDKIIGYDICKNAYDWRLTERYQNRYKDVTDEEFELIRKNVKEGVKCLLYKINKIMDNQYDCYYVLDQDNCLQEFIPVAAKESIKVHFKNKKSNNIIIEGCFYRYYEIGAQWGKCEYTLTKIIRKIYINRYNNNVEKVVSNEKILNEGEVGGKDYWSHYDDYCMSHLDDNEKCVNTQSFDYVLEPMKSHIQSSMRYIGTDEEKLKLLNECHEKYDDRYRKSYGEELTDEIINQYILKYTYYRL